MDREHALLAFMDYASGEECAAPVYLPPEFLAQISAQDLPIDVPVRVGNHGDGYIEELWEGTLTRNEGKSFSVLICHEIWPKYWPEAVGARFWLDLLRQCVCSRLDIVHGLKIVEFDDSDDFAIRFEYSFPVDGPDLQTIFNEARRTQREIEAPAQSVLNDVTRALAVSAEKILHGQHIKTVDLVTKVDAAESPAEKGGALEALMAALFEQVAGFSVWRRNVRTETEEFDLVILNGSQDPVFAKDAPIILVECKNWTSRAGRPEFSMLESKMRNRYGRCSIVFVVSWTGFADTVRRESLRASREHYALVCLPGQDVRNAALAGNFPEFLRKATLEALTL